MRRHDGRARAPVDRRGARELQRRVPRHHHLEDPVPREPGPDRPRAHAVGVPQVLRQRHRPAPVDPAPAEGELPAAEGHQGAARRAAARGRGPPVRDRRRARRRGAAEGDADGAVGHGRGRGRPACRRSGRARSERRRADSPRAGSAVASPTPAACRPGDRRPAVRRPSRPRPRRQRRRRPRRVAARPPGGRRSLLACRARRPRPASSSRRSRSSRATG